MKWVVWHSRSWLRVVLVLACSHVRAHFFRTFFFIYRVMTLNVSSFSNELFHCIYFFVSLSHAHALSLSLPPFCWLSASLILSDILLSTFLRPVHHLPPCTNPTSPCPFPSHLSNSSRSLLSLSWVLQTHAWPYDSALIATAACLAAIKSSAMVSISFLFAFTPCFSVSTVYALCLVPTCIVLSAYLAPTSVLNASIHWSHSFPFMLNFLLLSSLYIPIKWETHYGLSLSLLLPRLLPHTSPCFPFAFLSNFFFFFFVRSSLAFFLPLVVLLATLCFSFYCCFISVLHVRKRFLFFPFLRWLTSFPALQRLFVFFFSPYVTLVLDAWLSSSAPLSLSA